MDNCSDPNDLETRATKFLDLETERRKREAGGKSGKKKARPATQEATARAATIQIQPNLLPEMTDQAEAVLIDQGISIFQRSGYLCRIARQQANTVRGIARPDGAVTIAALDVDFLLDALNRTVCWQKYDRKQDDWVSANAPRGVATTLLARSGH